MRDNLKKLMAMHDAGHDDSIFRAKINFVKAREADAQALRKAEAVESVRQKLANCEQTLAEATSRSAKLRKELDSERGQNRLQAEFAKQTEEKLAELRESLEDAEGRREEKERALEDVAESIKLRTKEIRDLETKIRAEKTHAGKAGAEALKATLNAKLGQLRASEGALNEKIKECGGRRHTHSEHQQELRAKARQMADLARSKTHERKAAASRIESERRSQSRQQENEVSQRFGRAMSNLVAEIDQRAGAAAFFKTKPIGPIGRYLRLASENYADFAGVIESYLGSGFLKTFLVDNSDDQRRMRELISRHFPRDYPPPVTKMRFGGGRKEAVVAARGVTATSDYRPLVDFLEFDDDTVYNYVVMDKSAHTTLLLSSDQAKHLFSVESRVPRNARLAITTDSYRYKPAPNYASYYMPERRATVITSPRESAASRMRELEEEVQNIDEVLSGLKTNLSSNAASQAAADATLGEIAKESESLRNELMRVRSDVQRAMAEMAGMEDGDRIKAWTEHVEAKRKSMAELQERRDKTREDLRAAKDLEGKMREAVGHKENELKTARSRLQTTR